MRKMLCLVFVLALLALAACGGAGNGTGSSNISQVPPAPESSQEEQQLSSTEPDPPFQQPQQPERQEREPIGSPAVVAYPELLPEELISSPLYQQAITRPSVIVYEDEVVTDPRSVYDFLAAVEWGEDWDLYRYDFSGSADDGSLYFIHFISTGGVVRERGEFVWSWDSMTEEGSLSRVGRLELNDYGYLTYQSIGDNGFPVISDRDLYDNAEERRQMRKTYLYPIYYTGIGCGYTWSTPFVDMSWLYLFEDIYNYEHEGTPWDEYGSDWPVDYMVQTLSRYFDGVTADVFISSFKPGRSPYDPETNTVHYEGGRGGAIPDARVTGWTQEGDILTIDYHRYEYYSGLPVGGESRRLTVRLLEDGTFRYLSNLEL